MIAKSAAYKYLLCTYTPATAIYTYCHTLPRHDAFTSVRRPERYNAVACGEDEQARFLAVEEFLDHRLAARAASGNQRVDRRLGLLARLGDRHALARGEPIGLAPHRDRKSVVSGTSVPVRVDRGGRSIINKHTNNIQASDYGYKTLRSSAKSRS